MRCLLFFILHSSFFIVATAQQPFHRDIPLTESGAPVHVNDMVFDAQGYLWLGTSDGLFRYNGRAVSQPDSSGGSVTALVVAGKRLFIGYADGRVGEWRDGEFNVLFEMSGPVTSMLPSTLGLLVGTGGAGVMLLRREGAYRLTASNGLSDDYVYTLALAKGSKSAARAETLLIGTDRGITAVSASNGRLHFTRISTSTHPNLGDDIVRVIEWHPSLTFIGTEAAGFRMMFHNGRDWQVIPFKNWHGGAINDALFRPQFHRYIAAESGLYYRRGYGQEDKPLLTGRAVHCILRSPAGNLYLATPDGLTVLTSEYLETLDAGPSYDLRQLAALTADRAGVLWYALDKTLYSYDTATSSHLRFSAPESITSLYSDAHHRLWIGTLGGGLLCMEGGTVHTVTGVENLHGGHILHVAGRGDTLWVSSLNGVEELYVPPALTRTPRVIQHHGRAVGAGSDYVYQLYPDSRGRLWLATDGAGIVMWDGVRYHRWDSSAGFAPRVVYSVVEDARGNIWAGTLEGGALRWDGRHWKAFRREHGLQDNTVLSLAALADGSVVVVNEVGADQWLPESSEFRQYSRRMGLHIDSFSKVLNAVTTDVAGNAIVPYEHGFLVMKASVQPPDLRPRISLCAIELFSKEVDTARHDFGPDENGIGFRYEGIHFAAPERLRYRYRLRGYNHEWVETGDEAVTFPRLPPGRYTFEVQAALGASFVNVATAGYSFRIAAPLWQRPLFWIVLVAAGAGVGYALLKRRDNARQRLAALEQGRLRAEYEQLKSQVNPHFLFNSLNTLVGLIEDDPRAAARYTEQLSDLYRDTLAFRNRDLVTLGEEWAVLQKYLFIQQSRFGTALRLDAELPEDVMRDGKVIPLALQLLVENAIKHNVVSRAHPLTIRIAATTESLTVCNIIRPKATDEKGAGMGLHNIQSRYALLTDRRVVIEKGSESFTVILPIL